jgi:hypothetical protein
MEKDGAVAAEKQHIEHFARPPKVHRAARREQHGLQRRARAPE